MQAEFVEADGMVDLEMQLLSSPPVDNNGGGGGGDFFRAKQVVHRAILIFRTVEIFIAGINHGAPPVSTAASSGISDLEHHVGIDSMEVDAALTTPLLNTVEKSLHYRKQIRTLTHIQRSILAFKAHAASSFNHHGSSSATQLELQLSQRENISKIVQEKNLLTFKEFGGLRAVAVALDTNLVTGLSEHEAMNRRLEVNPSQAPTVHTFFHLIRESLMTRTILFLSVAIFLSIMLEINQEGLKYGWHDGVVVVIAIILLVFFASIRKYRQEQRTRKMFLKEQPFPQERVPKNVHVIRGGVEHLAFETELVFGDVILVTKGCQVPADGLFVDGEALELDYGSQPPIIDQHNPFLSYGERVINGNAYMVVTSNNMENTGWSEMMRKASSCGQENRINLVIALDKLNTCMHYSALIISILIILVLIFRFMAGKMDDENGYRPESMAEQTSAKTFASNLMKIFKESNKTARALTKLLSVSLVGITEGVPFVVSLAIIYLNGKALFGNATEQDSQGVAKMASVTRICTDLFGDFTEDEMEVEKLFVGKDISGCATLSPKVIEALCDGIGSLKKNTFLHWAKDKLGYKSERMIQRWEVLETKGMNPFEEPCRVWMRGIEETIGMVLHLNGPLKEILDMCAHYYDVYGQQVPMNDEVKWSFNQANENMRLKNKLMTIAFAFKHVDTQTQDANDFILVALLGLENKSKEATKTKVHACRELGIEAIIVSSKKLSDVQHIAVQYGIITDGDSESSVLTGDVFRKYDDKERVDKVNKIRVLEEATSSDKLLLVETLRKQGEVVAFLGQRTNEAPAIKGADIGIAMGTWSSLKAREICDIFIHDGNFSDVIKMVDSGKCIYQNIQCFLQLVQISITSSTLITFIETAAFGDASLTIVQLVWVNFAVTFLGGLALLTKPSTEKPVSFVPVSCKRALITAQMTRNILLQVLFQAICAVIIQLKASAVLGTDQYTKTIASNLFIFCQFFNQFNARELQNKNFFRGIHWHKEFWVSVATFILLHATLVMVQDTFGYGTRLNWKLWAGCVAVAVVSWLVDWLGKCISWFIKIFVS